jgi:hypothetical protein
MTTVYHLSDEPGIELFEPRTGGYRFETEAVVWAIDREHLPNYLFPRDCPRVTFVARPDSDPSDVERLMGTSGAKRVIAIESAWYERIRESRLHRYELDARTFTMVDEIAGYLISREPVVPVSEREIGDILGELVAHDVELRFLPSLWKLREAVIHSTLEFSIVRMRNAQPPEEGYDAYYPLPQ